MFKTTLEEFVRQSFRERNMYEQNFVTATQFVAKMALVNKKLILVSCFLKVYKSADRRYLKLEIQTI